MDRFAERAPQRGYQIHYRGGATACPACSRSNWHVGRRSAECGFCATALPLAPEAVAA